MSYTEISLGEIASMRYGKIPKKDILLPDGGYPVFSGYRITGYAKEYLYDEPMLIVVARGVGGTGDVKISPPKSWITNLSIVLDLNKKLVDKWYLKYKLSLENLREKLNTGAAQAQITIENLSRYKIKIPSLAEQRKISSLLSAYDDLIENNRRRIQLLEQAARLLYKEWFVHLRFPGHEHVKIKDGIPEGWERKRLGDVTTLKYGKALKKDDRVPGPFPVYGSSGIVGTHEKPLVKGPGIIVGRKGNVGSVYWSENDYYPIDTVYYIDSMESSLFLYYALQHISFINTDVAVPGLNRDYAHSRELVIPDSRTRSLFEEYVTPMRQQIYGLRKCNDTLAKARDLLLPRLMNGEIAL